MRSSTLWNRLKTACQFVIYGKSNAQLMTCGKCNRICITTISSKPLVSDHITESKHIDLYWAQFVQCRHCGAVCEEVQLWNYAGDVLQIDDNITVGKRDKERYC